MGVSTRHGEVDHTGTWIDKSQAKKRRRTRRKAHGRKQKSLRRKLYNMQDYPL